MTTIRILAMAGSADAAAADGVIESENEIEIPNEIEKTNDMENTNEVEKANEIEDTNEIENDRMIENGTGNENAPTAPPHAPTPPPPPSIPSQPDSNPLNNTKEDTILTPGRYKSMAKLHALLSNPTSPNTPAPEADPAARLRSHVAAALAHLQQVIAHDKAAKMQLTPAQRKLVFPFLALPAELRILVYEELLVSDDRLFVTWRGPRKARVQQKKIWASVLRVSKLVGREARAVLYGGNVFDFGMLSFPLFLLCGCLEDRFRDE
ncbi:hypothetical protein BU16DRAFT_378108 [Lophium mytilinum]|uniref:F-box domain-containing protein n=1 Tax=Lophium mytilinum TaxID=390894 RepID=A0A6A6QXS9_9PEZI|nr:hypothetical protein BU16DRAFT_378108 [Lophium mytilinum]